MSITETSKIKTLNLSEKIRCYAQMFKLKLTAFVVVSAVMGYFMGGASFNLTEIIFLIIGFILFSFSKSENNTELDKIIDANPSCKYQKKNSNSSKNYTSKEMMLKKILTP